MRIPIAVYTCRSWRIHDLADDFAVEDVWALPTPGGPDDLAKFARQFTSGGVSDPIVRVLLALRWKLGALFGLDESDAGVGARVATLRDQLPDDLRNGPRGPDFQSVPFRSVYQTDTEWVAELANRTVHALMHIGWVSDGADDYHAEMTVLVQPNGLFGEIYLAAIKPIRLFLVYPMLIRSIGRDWERTR
ncbi:DUF2867 domain-containing protein [Nocardia sp. CA-128927]|uniref:DUF2867 domain-containing protein n=1 Tax=Nocardia sp. CA-128927 TaxID=3239975 RepID=UPI003D95D444